jgi:hypothetical protein
MTPITGSFSGGEEEIERFKHQKRGTFPESGLGWFRKEAHLFAGAETS